MCRAVQVAAVRLIRSQAVQRVGARIHGVEMRTVQHDRSQNVADPQGIALDGVDSDDVVAELGEHGLAEDAGCEPPQRRGEWRDEARSASEGRRRVGSDVAQLISPLARTALVGLGEPPRAPRQTVALALA